MKNRPVVRLFVEELERRLAPSTTPLPILQAQSTNWSGYAVTASSGSVTDVKGSWVIPTVPSGPATQNTYSAAWVGIDGAASATVEQIGTDSDVQNGVPTYYAWFEMYPGPAYYANLTVHPGDHISAEVTYSGSYRSYSLFTLQIQDTTTGGSFKTSQWIRNAQRSSAEWIQEAPSDSSGVVPLANFGTVTFTGAQATLSGKAGPINNGAWNPNTTHVYAIDMIDSTGAAIATTSGLDSTGTSFSVAVGAIKPPAPGLAGGPLKHGSMELPFSVQHAAARGDFTMTELTGATPANPAINTVVAVGNGTASTPNTSAPAVSTFSVINNPAAVGGVEVWIGSTGVGTAGDDEGMNQKEEIQWTVPLPQGGAMAPPSVTPFNNKDIVGIAGVVRAEVTAEPYEQAPLWSNTTVDLAPRYAVDTPADHSAAALLLMGFTLGAGHYLTAVDSNAKTRRPNLPLC